MARPEKLTPEIQEKVVQLLTAGNYIETAALMAGITKVSVYNWLKKGRAAKGGMYREFFNAIERAQAAAENRSVLLIGRAANDQWQAAAWMLERKFPAKWGLRVQVTVREELAAALARLQERLTPDEYEKVVAVLSDSVGVGDGEPSRVSALLVETTADVR